MLVQFFTPSLKRIRQTAYICQLSITVTKNLRRKGLLCFRVLSPWSLGSVAFGPVVAQQIMAVACGTGSLVTCWQPEAKKKTG
jgi:hypothetical protein